jgi:hypothetical protein
MTPEQIYTALLELDSVQRIETIQAVMTQISIPEMSELSRSAVTIMGHKLEEELSK